MLKSASIPIIIAIFGLMMIFGCSGDKNPANNQPIDNQAPAAATNPSPANGAVNVPSNFIFSWLCSDPENDTLTYDLYFGTTDSTIAILHHWDCANFESDWGLQIGARTMLHQIYSMQQAYHEQYGSYCLNGIIASMYAPDAFGILSIHIDSLDRYAYTMITHNNSFVCTADAPNLDADPSHDTWTVDESNTLTCTRNDVDIPFQTNMTYYWKIIANDNHQNATEGPIWQFTTGADSIL